MTSESLLGKIFKIQFSAGNADRIKTRLVMIVSEANEWEDLQVIFITVDKKSANAVEINSKDFTKSLSETKAFLNVDHIFSINRKCVAKPIGELSPEKFDLVLREIIKQNTRIHYLAYHKVKNSEKFVPEISKIPYAGRQYDEKEMENLIDSSLDFWLTAGRYAKEFESVFSRYLGVKNSLLVNSGSSANLIAFSTLTSAALKERQIKKGDEVITVAAGFPTTINPIIQAGAVPVFVDVSLPTYNIDVAYLGEALSDKTKAIMIAHTLGNPFDLGAVKSFCDKHNLWLIEDNCDALGSKYFINGEWRYTGTIGDIGTSSFFPPHHMTMGEGGAVYMNSNRLKKIAESIRDWGRDCWCPPGQDDTCSKRFQWGLGELPHGYDHKYIYSNFGYNLKVTDMQAAIGVAQLGKLDGFIEKRKENWFKLRKGLDNLSKFLILPEPAQNSDPSWFGFLLTIRDESNILRKDIVDFLERKKIQTRMLFAGNYLRQPVFDGMRKQKNGYRVIGSLSNTDKIMKDSFWVGVSPGINNEMNQYIIDSFQEYFRKF